MIDGQGHLIKQVQSTRTVTDFRERMAYAARSRSKAAGALAGVGGVFDGAEINLSSAQYNFQGNLNEHSAQFNWNCQRLTGFYSTLLDRLTRTP